MYVLFCKESIKSSLCCPYTLGCGGSLLKHSQSSQSKTLKENYPYSRSHQLSRAYQLEVGLMNPFPLCTRMLTGLILWQCCATENCCELRSMVIFPSIEDFVWLLCSPAYGFYTLFTSSSTMVLSLRYCVRSRCPICGWTLCWQLFSAFWQVVGFYINQCLLHTETSLMGSDICTNLWVKRC